MARKVGEMKAKSKSRPRHMETKEMKTMRRRRLVGAFLWIVAI